MSAATIAAPRIWTVADLYKRFGPIPANRIRHDPPPGLATEQDVVDIHAREGRLCELVDGVLVEKTVGAYESRVALLIGHSFEDYLEEYDQGVCLGSDGMLKLLLNRVRIPDVSFIPWDRIPNREFPKTPVPRLVPALAVEVLSESNTSEEMKLKLQEYFDAGVKLVWYIDPESRTAQVFTSLRRPKLIREDGALDGGDILPGFTLPLKKLFARALRGTGR